MERRGLEVVDRSFVCGQIKTSPHASRTLVSTDFVVHCPPCRCWRSWYSVVFGHPFLSDSWLSLDGTSPYIDNRANSSRCFLSSVDNRASPSWSLLSSFDNRASPSRGLTTSR